MSLASRLDKSLSLGVQAAVTDAIGGFTNSFSNSLTGVACCIYPATSRTIYDYARQDIVAEFEVITDVDIGAAAGNIITIAAKTYEVQGYKPFSALKFRGPQVFQTVTGRRNQT